MLLSAKNLCGRKIDAVDGEIGHIEDLLFNDEQWTIRYLAVEVGHQGSEGKVLIPAEDCGSGHTRSKGFAVNLLIKQILNEMSCDEKLPMSKRHKKELNEYYGGKICWAAGPIILKPSDVEPDIKDCHCDVHFRSTMEVIGYRINAHDGNIGHIEDFIINDENWNIQYIEIHTSNWLPGRKVVLSPKWISTCSYHDRKVDMSLLRKEIKDSPKYHDFQTIDREYEDKLFDHYGK